MVAKQGVQTAGLTAQDLAELDGVEAQGLRAEIRELFRGRLGTEEPDPCALLPRILGQDELRSALELEAERRGLRTGVARAQRLEPPGRHQVNHQDELAVLGREEQALAAALGSPEAAALEGLERRVERLQGRDMRRPRLRDRERRDRVIQPAPPRFHLR